jgi:hypothetical protein
MSDLPPPSPGQQPAWQPPSAPAAPSPAGPHAVESASTASARHPRSRLPILVGALAAVAVGLGAVWWLTRSGDDAADRSSNRTADQSSDDDADDADDADGSQEADDADDDGPASTELAVTTTIALTLPSTIVPTSSLAPTTDAATSTSVVDSTAAPAPATPAGAQPYVDPGGWSIAIDPAWQFQQSETFTGWLIGTGTEAFRDNVNVATEALPRELTLDEYAEAALGVIRRQASDVQIVDRRRVVGADGVGVEVIDWSGSFGTGQQLAFVQAMTVTPTNAYVATFTSEPDRMPDLAATVTAYLVTIRGT